eukprot:COSAG04_NODE_1461_length_6618_cov_2.665439_5_plen_498_part_00
MVRYLNAYLELHGLVEGQQLRYNSPVKQVATAPPTDGWGTGWEVTTADGGVFRAKAVAMCTGAAREPHLPRLPGEAEFKSAGGELLHSRHYTTGERFRGKRVAVVGSGNSGAEICVDLVEHGAEEVTMVVSGPRHWLDLGRMRWVHAVEQWLTSPQQTLSELHHIALGSNEWEENAAGVDAILKYFTHDLERFGIRKPALGPEQERSRAARQQDAAPGQARITTAPPRMPTLDVGMVPLLESGAVSVANGRAERLGKEGIAVRQPAEREGGAGALRWSGVDAVVLATGYRHGLASLLEPLLARSVLTPAAGQELLPLTDGRCQSVAQPSLYFVGWDTTLAFGLSWGHWGWEVGERLRRQLDAARPASARQPKPAPPPPPRSGRPDAARAVGRGARGRFRRRRRGGRCRGAATAAAGGRAQAAYEMKTVAGWCFSPRSTPRTTERHEFAVPNMAYMRRSATSAPAEGSRTATTRMPGLPLLVPWVAASQSGRGLPVRC